MEWSRGNVGGDCVFWELCGREEYLPSYHHALTYQQPAVHLVTISLREPLTVQLQQARFWLRYILDRIPPTNIGFGGRCNDVKVILVGTYAPEPPAPTSNGLGLLAPLLSLLNDYLPILGEDPQMVALDATNPSSPGLKLLRSYLTTIRAQFNEEALVWTGLVEAWRSHVQNIEDAPVMLTLEELLTDVRKVNPLASLDHCRQLGQQLQALGECVLLPDDLVVLNPEWLWRDVIGWQLSPEQRGRLGGRTTGVYTMDDFQARCPCPATQALQALQAMNLCVPCEVDEDEVEFELPCLNLIERLPGLWEPWKPCPTTLPHAGLRLCLGEASVYHLSPIFPHLQAQLRKVTQSWDLRDSDLYQWWRGSKLCVGPCESIVSLEEEDQGCIELRVRGPRGTSSQCAGLFNVILDALDTSIEIVAPGMLLEKHWLSPSQLRDYDEVIHSWEPSTFLSALIDRGLAESVMKNPFNGQQESIWEIVGFGLSLSDSTVPGSRLPVKQIKASVQRRLAQMLDPPDSHGRDWCLLAVRLGLGDRVAQFDSTTDSPTLRLLNCAGTDCTVGSLVRQLRALGREDAAHLLLSHTPTHYLSIVIDSETGSNLSR